MVKLQKIRFDFIAILFSELQCSVITNEYIYSEITSWKIDRSITLYQVPETEVISFDGVDSGFHFLQG